MADKKEEKKADHHFDPNTSADGGGMAPRGCTDIFCLLIFLAFQVGMGYVTHYGYQNGNPKRLTHGFNYAGDLCGVDPVVADRPFLYYCPMPLVAGQPAMVHQIPAALNLKAPVCVASCPKGTPDEKIACMQRSSATPVIAAPGNQVIALTQTITNMSTYVTKPVMGMYCIPDVEKLNAIAVANGMAPPGGLRESLMSSSGPMGKSSVKFAQHLGSLRRCWGLIIGMCFSAVILGFVYLFLLRCFAKPLVYLSIISLILLIFSVSGFFLIGEAMDRPAAVTSATAPAATVATASTTLAAGVAAAAASPTVAPTAPVVPAATPAATPAVPAPAGTPAAARRRLSEWEVAELNDAHAVIDAYPLMPSDGVRRLMTYESACVKAPAACKNLDERWEKYGGRKKYEKANPYYHEHMSRADAKKYSYWTGVVFGVLGLLCLLILCCFHNAINTAVGVVKSACECMFAMPCMLIMPPLESLLKFINFMILLANFTYVVSSGEMHQKTISTAGGAEINGLRRHFKYTDEQKYYIAYYVFGIFWSLELWNALGSFVISYAVVGWYYTPTAANGSKGHNWSGLFKGYLYGLTVHLGTLAFGSFMIALLRFIRLAAWIAEQQAKNNGNQVVVMIAKCIQACVSCLKKLVEKFNKNAYIDVAINSTNFCGAAAHVISFLASEAPTILLLNGACFIFSFAGVGIIAGSNAYLSYYLCTSQDRWTSNTSPHHVESPRIVAGVIFLLSGVIALSFMNLFDLTADTLLYTYCWNKSHAHNTVPKYAPQGLQDLVEHKQLEKPKEGAKAAGGGGGGGGGGFFASLFGGSPKETEPLIKK